MFHLQTDASWGTIPEPFRCFHFVCLEGPKSIPVGGDGGSFEVYVALKETLPN